MRLLLLAGLLVLAGCGAPVPGEASPQPVIVSEVPAAAVVEPILEPVRVDIPALGVTDELVPVGLAPDRSMEIPPVDRVGFYKLGPVPGEVGPAVLAGHVNYQGVAGSFQRIGDLKPGDRITVTGRDGAALTFEVYDVTQFPKAAFRYDFVFGNRAAPELVLVTCSGTVVDHSYLDNTAVAARLVTT
jgi:sortase (surface protein transpeptidase)